MKAEPESKHVAYDSKERVALDLAKLITSMPNSFLQERLDDPKTFYMDLYRECFALVSTGK